MRVLTGKEMNKIDLWAQKEMGIPTLLLMENAGQAVANKAKSILGEAQDKMVILLAGKGNNGGDALVAARQLAQLGYEIKLFLLFPPEYFPVSYTHLDVYKRQSSNLSKYSFSNPANSLLSSAIKTLILSTSNRPPLPL